MAGTGMSSQKAAWSIGGMVFAATLLLINGILQAIQGLAAVVQGDFFVTTPNYAFNVSVTSWGWIHLVVGVVVALVGGFLYRGSPTARVLAIFIASLQALSQFFFLPYYPLWSILIFALDVFVIWAIATAPRVD